MDVFRFAPLATMAISTMGFVGAITPGSPEQHGVCGVLAAVSLVISMSIQCLVTEKWNG